MADSVFDNRYRYDYIYPRGRSGETLRAVDLEVNNRLVVIKRPAPNDAPPIRAGQEVSISNEQEALKRLSGHPVLTELMGTGQFFVGGMPHQYIVMERAEGQIVAEMVSELASQGETLPELEALIIIDNLLDLLHKAHAHDIVYNDVDAKHLFWNRDTYSLKVIDWGNAVFLEGDDATPQGVSRLSDIYQVGELLYFIFSGGRRADVPRDAEQFWRIDFPDGFRVASRLQDIISKALHPNTQIRYQTIGELRNEIMHYRSPMERERNAAVGRVSERLKREQLSKNELLSLQTMIEPVLQRDPGYPSARTVNDEITNRLRDLQVSADLDAVRIYLDSENWSRAADLLNELRDQTGTQTAGIVRLLLDVCILQMDSGIQPAPTPVMDAVMLIFDNKPQQAAETLLLRPSQGPDARALQWQMAERITSHMPEILLLQPNLYRLANAIHHLANDGIPIDEPRKILVEVNKILEKTTQKDNLHIAEIRDTYRQVVDQLSSLNPILQTLSLQHQFSERRLPLGALTRALNAAMALADNMHVIGKQAAASPRDAQGAVESSRLIDPTNPIWDGITEFLDRLYEILQACQTYVPAADGSDLEGWLKLKQGELKTFVERLFDEMLVQMVDGLTIADSAWRDYRQMVISGNRVESMTSLTNAAEAVTTLSPTLAAWLNQLRNIINGANYVERHSVPGGLGRALADGWEAFDRGRLNDAEHLGGQAFEIARNEIEQFAAQRLQDISRIARTWLDQHSVENNARTQKALADVERLFTREEKVTLDEFSAQMPSNDTYLRAMSRGLVNVYARTSTAAQRILYLLYVFTGTLDAHDGHLSDAEFWHEAALKTLEERATRHVVGRALHDYIARRYDITQATDLLNQLNSREAIDQLEPTRLQLESNPQANTLAPGIQSVRDVQVAIRQWSEADFRGAGMKLESALTGVTALEENAEMTLTHYRAWLMDLQAGAAELHVQAREMLTAIDKRDEEPNPLIQEAHHNQVQVTTRLLGEEYTATMRDWQDTYDTFLGVYTDDAIRRSRKLERFNELFQAVFLDRHPAYPLYRHWVNTTESAPEFPAPPTDEPIPQIHDESDIPASYLGDVDAELVDPQGGRRIPRGVILGGLLGIVIVVALALLAAGGNSEGGLGIELTITDTPTVDTTGTADTLLVAEQTDTPEPPTATEVVSVAQTTEVTPTNFITDTPIPTDEPTTHASTDTATPITPTNTPTSTPTVPTDTPTASYTPSITPTPSNTPTSTVTPTPTLPPEGLRGAQNALDLLADQDIEELPWSPEVFYQQDDAWRLGVGTETDDDVLFIRLPEDILEIAYGNNPATRITRVEAELILLTFNPAVVTNEDVYFGLLLESAEDGNNVGIQVQAANSTAVNLGQVTNNEVDYLSQRAVNAVIARLRIDRDLNTGAVIVFFNDAQIGTAMDFVDPETPVLPVLFVKDGGVILGVSNWRITLR